MIPKIIHYCWLSGDPIPDNLQKCMNTWKKNLPDYEFILWDKQRFDINSVAWVKEAYEAKKYAFAADYIRQYAVYNYGGIYMDMDVEVVRPFEELLEKSYMLGSEVALRIEAGIFGAEAGCKFMKWCLDFYENNHFLLPDGSYNTCGAPNVMNKCIAEHRKLVISDEHGDDISTVYLYPFEYLTAKSGDTGVVKVTKRTRTIHHFAGSWLKQTPITIVRRNMKLILVKVFGENWARSISNFVFRR